MPSSPTAYEQAVPGRMGSISCPSPSAAHQLGLTHQQAGAFLFSRRLIEMEEMGQGKAMQFSAI